MTQSVHPPNAHGWFFYHYYYSVVHFFLPDYSFLKSGDCILLKQQAIEAYIYTYIHIFTFRLSDLRQVTWLSKYCAVGVPFRSCENIFLVHRTHNTQSKPIMLPISLAIEMDSRGAHDPHWPIRVPLQDFAKWCWGPLGSFAFCCRVVLAWT